MKTLKKLFVLFALIAACASLSHAQTALTKTTLSSQLGVATQTAPTQQSVIYLASVSGITGQTTQTNSEVWIDAELMDVISVNTVANTVTVARGVGQTQATVHVSGSIVYIGPPTAFQPIDPPLGQCAYQGYPFTPYINVATARQFICDATTGNWLPVLSTGSITPSATSAAIQTAGQTFTLNGVISGMPLVMINEPAPTSLCPATSARATAANQVTIYFTVLTAAACTPASGTYMFLQNEVHVGAR